jgi:hypothetical protein
MYMSRLSFGLGKMAEFIRRRSLRPTRVAARQKRLYSNVFGL